jgi:hypothetical protein
MNLERTPVVGLLDIDVDAEIRKLCGQQVGSVAERLADLVRLCVASGACDIKLRLRLGRLRIDAADASLPRETLELLCTVRDRRAAPDLRHEALTACEAHSGLLSLLGEPVFRLRTPAGELVARPHRAKLRPQRTRPGVQITLGRTIERDALHGLLQSVRFAKIPIHLGRRRVNTAAGLPDVLVDVAFDLGRVHGVIGIPKRDELCRTLVLKQEVVSQELVRLSRRGAAHLAVLRPRHAALPGLSDDLARLQDQLYTELAARFPRLPPAEQALAKAALLRRCRAPGGLDPTQTALLAGLPLFLRQDAERVDIDQVAKAAQNGTVWAVAPSKRRRDVSHPEQVFVLDDTERAFLGEALAVHFSEPPRPAKPPGVFLRFRQRLGGRLWRRWRDAVLRAVGRGRAFFGHGGVLANADLTEAERELIAAINTELEAGRWAIPSWPIELSQRAKVAMTRRGALPLLPSKPRPGKRPTLLLPRSGAQALVRAFANDRELLFPILALLLGGQDGCGTHRAHWRARVLGQGQNSLA